MRARGIDAAEVLPELVMSVAMMAWLSPIAFGERVDDAQVGLVGDEDLDVGGGDSGPAAGFAGDCGDLFDGPAEHVSPGHAQVAGLVGVDQVVLYAVAAGDQWADALGSVVGWSDDGGAGAVAEDDGGVLVGGVDQAAHVFGCDH